MVQPREHRLMVVVTSSFPIRADGSEAAGSFVADLVEELAKHGDVRVVAPGPKAARERWSEYVEVCRYAAPARALSTLKPWRPRDAYWLWRILRGGQQVTRDAVADGATQVLALWGLPCGEWARRATRGSDIGYSVWMLGSDVWTLGRMPVVRGWLARVIQQARQAWADGYQLAADAATIGGVDVDFLPSTRRIDLVDPPPVRSQPPYRLLFLGRWHPNKGIDLLVDALALLDADDWSRIETVEIQGGGPLQALVRTRVTALQRDGHPVMLGHFLAKPEAEAALARADWVLIPSRVESIPVVFSDAMKTGRPIVAMPVGDLTALFDHAACGQLAGAVTATAFAGALREALCVDPVSFHAAVGAHAETFDLTTLAERLVTEALADE